MRPREAPQDPPWPFRDPLGARPETPGFSVGQPWGARGAWEPPVKLPGRPRRGREPDSTRGRPGSAREPVRTPPQIRGAREAPQKPRCAWSGPKSSNTLGSPRSAQESLGKPLGGGRFASPGEAAESHPASPHPPLPPLRPSRRDALPSRPSKPSDPPGSCESTPPNPLTLPLGPRQPFVSPFPSSALTTFAGHCEAPLKSRLSDSRAMRPVLGRPPRRHRGRGTERRQSKSQRRRGGRATFLSRVHTPLPPFRPSRRSSDLILQPLLLLSPASPSRPSTPAPSTPILHFP